MRWGAPHLLCEGKKGPTEEVQFPNMEDGVRPIASSRLAPHTSLPHSLLPQRPLFQQPCHDVHPFLPVRGALGPVDVGPKRTLLLLLQIPQLLDLLFVEVLVVPLVRPSPHHLPPRGLASLPLGNFWQPGGLVGRRGNRGQCVRFVALLERRFQLHLSLLSLVFVGVVQVVKPRLLPVVRVLPLAGKVVRGAPATPFFLLSGT